MDLPLPLQICDSSADPVHDPPVKISSGIAGAKKKRGPIVDGSTTVPSGEEAGGDVLSHRVSPAVPSALRGLTAVFGMGTGVALAL
jgi:hypothetical protein